MIKLLYLNSYTIKVVSKGNVNGGLNIGKEVGLDLANSRRLLAATAFLASRLAVAYVLPSLNGDGIAGYSFLFGMYSAYGSKGIVEL